MMKLLRYKVRFHFRDLFITEKWKIGILEAEVNAIVRPGEINFPEPEWLEMDAERYQYHADSFGFIKDGMIHIICEEYDYKKAKGMLVSLQIERNTRKVIRKTAALEKDHHLAYPYLFEHDGHWYCIPESSEAGNVELYSYDIPSGKLRFECILIENLQAVDPTLFFHGGYWWLFFTDRVSTNERLHIWYSAELIGKYLSHANNPVKTDVRSARPAGNPFLMDGQLFRPAQDCSIRSGRRISVNRVQKLTPTGFEEDVFAEINPSLKSGWNDGIHTICANNGLIVVDSKKECFIWQAFARKLKQKTNRLFLKRSK